MGCIYYKDLKESNKGSNNNHFKGGEYTGCNNNEKKNDNSYWEEGAPYFFPGDILAVLGQQIFYKEDGQEKRVPVSGLQCCTVKVSSGIDSEGDFTYTTTLVLCPTVKIDNQIYRPTGLYYDQANHPDKSNFYTKNTQGEMDIRGMFCAGSCRCVNHTIDYPISNLKADVQAFDLNKHTLFLEDGHSTKNKEGNVQKLKTFIEPTNYIPQVIID